MTELHWYIVGLSEEQGSPRTVPRGIPQVRGHDWDDVTMY